MLNFEFVGTFHPFPHYLIYNSGKLHSQSITKANAKAKMTAKAHKSGKTPTIGRRVRTRLIQRNVEKLHAAIIASKSEHFKRLCTEADFGPSAPTRQ